jgi:hypothetical protein
MFIYSLWKDDKKQITSSNLQDIIDFVENHGIFIQDVDDLLDTDVMQEYTFEVERFTNFDENY